ncbi:hypothetical protein ACP70R_040859 [Stipagrostis hirtigluma subsp. patula]
MKMFRDPPPEIAHPAHPAHKLTLADAPPFVCDACKEDGDGHGYSCEPCDFHLHTPCALAERHATLENPLLRGAVFLLLDEPEPEPATNCDACGGRVRGLHYHCSGRKDFDYHPVCANLADRPMGDHLLQLRREPKRHWNLSRCSWRCLLCPYANSGTRRNPSDYWWYRCTHDGEVVDLHLACIKDLARLRWRTEHENRVGGGGQIVEAVAPLVEGALRNRPRNRRTTRVPSFCNTVATVVKVAAALLSGNPFGMIAAVAGPAGELLQD